MNVQYAPELLQPADRLAQLKDISARLDTAVGPKESAAMTAEWEFVRDLRDDEFYRLTLDDGTDRVATDFTRFELGIPLHVQFRVNGLYQNILSLRSDRNMALIHQLVGELSAE